MLIQTSGVERECPKCKSENYRYASLRFYEYLALPFYFRPFRCNKCQQRFWGFRTRRARKAAQYVFIIGGSLQALIWGVIVLIGATSQR